MVNEKLANKLREALAGVANVEEKKMFSGIAFMVNGKLCVTAGDDRIMCRVDPALHSELVLKPGCSTVNMKGRDYKGYVWVNESVLTLQKQVDFWVKLALDFNPQAKTSIKKRTGVKKR